ncbi:uncharacterized protein [Clytia hemisphaerica]|uniref:Uncharacterized protein n=1 Tax=Clytia hemisphaerica TaxID=252671 RepID=A0A7M5UJ97_9CNID
MEKNLRQTTYDDDFDMFGEVVNDVAQRKQNEENFFNVETKPNTPPTTNLLMEVNSSESPAVSRQSVYLDGTLTPSAARARTGSSRSASNLSMDGFEGIETEREHNFSYDIRDSFDDIEVQSRLSRRTDSDPVVERFYNDSIIEETVGEKSMEKRLSTPDAVISRRNTPSNETIEHTENNHDREIATPTSEYSPRNNFDEPHNKDTLAINKGDYISVEIKKSETPSLQEKSDSPRNDYDNIENNEKDNKLNRSSSVESPRENVDKAEDTTSDNNDDNDHETEKESESHEQTYESPRENVDKGEETMSDNNDNDDETENKSESHEQSYDKTDQSDFKSILHYKDSLEAENEKSTEKKTENSTDKDYEQNDNQTEEREILEDENESLTENEGADEDENIESETTPRDEDSREKEDDNTERGEIYRNIKEVNNDFNEVKKGKIKLSSGKEINEKFEEGDSGNESNASKESSIAMTTEENKLIKNEDGENEQSKSENLVNGIPQEKKEKNNDDLDEDKEGSEGKPEKLTLLEDMMRDLQREIDEEKEEPQKKKKTVIFKRDGDTYDEKGDRRYDMSALEMVSEDENEFVNLQEVQQARIELNDYAKDLDNFNHIINELEKTPEEKRMESNRSLTFDLGDLGIDDFEDEEREGSTNRKTPKKAKKIKKKKKKTDVVYSKVCQKCRNPIFKKDSYLELNEIFSDSVLCKKCLAGKSNNKGKEKKIEKSPKHDIGRIKAEVKPALDSRLEKSENTALQKWLEKKSKEERVRKRQERRERKAKAKEIKQKKREESEKQKMVKQKVDDWEEKKKKEAKENKKREKISLLLNSDKSRPILHSQNRGSNSSYMSTSATDSPRSNATFEVTEENSFEKFREDFLQHSEATPPSELTYGSVKDFVQSVILSALLEIEKEQSHPKPLTIKRPKSHAPALRNQQRHLQPRPPPPKSAHARKSQNLPLRRIKTKEHTQSNKNVTPKGLMRAKTYDEWMFDKKVQRGVKEKEKEINEHYDLLQQKLIELEKDRRNALYHLRESSMIEYHHKQLPLLSKRLEPQGSESSSIKSYLSNL